jgi:hypothetical protein
MTKTRDLADLGGGFIQAGTGAVQRTVESKLQDVVSVKDFGAVGDGVADDAAAIQTAIDAVTAAGGGTVYIPEGVYFIGTTSLRCRYAGVSIVGDGGASIIKTSSTMTAPALYWGENGYTPRPQNSVVRGITIDGNGSSDANAHGISVWASLSTIRDCHVKNCGGAGMYFYLSWTMWAEYNHIYGCGTGVYIGQECNNFTFFSNEINWCTGHGIHVNGGHGVRIQNNGVEECQKYGLYVQGNALSAIRVVLYEGNYHERNAKDASFPYEVYVDKESAEVSNVVLRNNYITNDQSPTRDVRIHSVDGASLEGNTLQGLTTQNITNPSVATAYGVYSPVRHYYGTAVPATGTYGVGDIVWNTNPASTTTTPAGWICITAGTPGAWRRFGHVSPASQTNADLYGQFYFDVTLQAISGYVAQLANTRGAGDTGGHVLYLDAYRSDTTNTRLIGTRDDKWILYSNGTTGGTSDVTLKKNIETTRDGYLEDLNQLRVVKYNWLTQDDDSPKELGLIAQEVESVFPGLVQEAENAEGQNIKSIKTSVLPYMLLKALQEAAERIKTLEEKVTELS